MKIEFLYFEGCANYNMALILLRKILKEEGIESPVEMIQVKSDEMAEELEFPGSPTIRINGKDIEKIYQAPLKLGTSQKCRVYEDNGTLKGVPPEEWICNAITGTLPNR